MRPFARGAEVLLTSIKPDGEHRLTNTGPDVVGLVLALGHERLLGCCQSHARREEEGAARHRALTPTTRSPDGRRRRAVDASQRWRAAIAEADAPPLCAPTGLVGEVSSDEDEEEEEYSWLDLGLPLLTRGRSGRRRARSKL